MPQSPKPLKSLFLRACLALALASPAMAQTFNVSSNSASMYLNLEGHPFASESTAGPFTTINWNDVSSNSASDYYLASQNTVVTPTSMTTHLDLEMHRQVVSGAAVASDFLSMNFSVSSPTTVSLTSAGGNGLAIGFDGPAPSWEVFSIDDPNMLGGRYDTTTWTTATLQPGYTYTFYDQMAGYAYAAPVDENGAFQLDMTLSVVPTPEPSSYALIALALIPFIARKNRLPK